MPAISVVIPVFNGERFIGEAIQSVWDQTYRALEIILVDDGSTDQTEAAVNKLVGPIPIGYFRQQNQGQAAALNAGVSIARGDWVAFLDADDVWYPDKLAVQVEFVDSHPQVPFVYSGMDCIDEAGRLQRPSKWIAKLDPLFKDRPFAFPSTVLMQKAMFVKTGGFNPRLRLLNDWELFTRIARTYPVHHIPHSLVKYRRYPSQTSKDKRLWIECVPLYHRCARDLWSDDPGKLSVLDRRIAAVYADLGRHCLRAGDFDTARGMCQLSFSLRRWSWSNLRRWGLSYLPGAREWYRYRKMKRQAY